MVYYTLSFIIKSCAHPGCDAKIRRVAGSLGFCLINEHDLDCIRDNGMTTAGATAQICCGVFGRDEDGSEFSFLSQHVEAL